MSGNLIAVRGMSGKCSGLEIFGRDVSSTFVLVLRLLHFLVITVSCIGLMHKSSKNDIKKPFS